MTRRIIGFLVTLALGLLAVSLAADAPFELVDLRANGAPSSAAETGTLP